MWSSISRTCGSICRSAAPGALAAGADGAPGRRGGGHGEGGRARSRPLLPGGAPLGQHCREQHAELVEQVERQCLQHHRGHVAGQDCGNQRAEHQRVAPGFAQLLGRDDARLGDAEHGDRDLEDQAHRDQHHRCEFVVGVALNQDVELATVEVLEEVDGRRQHHEVAEHHPGDEQKRHRHQQRQRHAPLGRTEGRQDEPVKLEQQHRQREQQREVERDGDGRGERFAEADRGWVVAFRSGRDCGDAGFQSRQLRRQLAARRAREPAAGGTQDLDARFGFARHLTQRALHLPGLAGRTFPALHLRARLLLERRVDHVQQRFVLPEAESERDHERQPADDQTSTQLI